jgi:hypothetical protein
MARAERDPHDEAQKHAAQAEHALLAGDPLKAAQRYGRAAEYEMKALALADQQAQGPRTWSILSLSYAALLYKAGELAKAESAIYRFLADERRTSRAREQLRELLEVVWEEQVVRGEGLRYSGEEIEVSLRGGKIGRGTAPLDTALDSIRGLHSLAYRVAEMEAGFELRRHGPPPTAVQEALRARATQPAAGSYRFKIRFMKPAQGFLPEMGPATVVVAPERLTSVLIGIVRATAAQDIKQLELLAPNRDYRLTLLKLARNIAPTGSSLKEVEIRRTGDPAITAVRLTSDSRRLAREAIRHYAPPTASREETTLRGVLRALDLDHRRLSITDPRSHERTLVRTTREYQIDDVIGPMVNRHVVARVVRKGSGFVLRDVELESE